SGDGFGYAATDRAYRDYHLVVEDKWGRRTDGRPYVRNSGVLLHATGPDGGAGGTWMSCIECQLAQGCVGDLIVIRGQAAKGAVTAGQLAIPPNAHAAGGDTLRVGLVGCGGRGTGAAGQALNADSNVKLVAMGDAFEDRLQQSLNTLKSDSKIAAKIDVPPER